MDEKAKSELRCKIAKALGASIAHSGYTHSYQCTVNWKGKTESGGSVTRALDLAGVPNWPGDAGEAQSLCLEIADDNDWRLVIAPKKYVAFEAFAYTYGKWQEVDAVFFDDEVVNTSEALAHLTPAALKAKSK